jgi:processive 1,2-diacylglycerol beta-glucosyltransferase
MRRMKVLILHASVGGGHRAAAHALEEAFGEVDAGGSAEVRDVLDFTPAFFRNAYRESYAWLVSRRPELWGYLYEQGPARSAERAKARVVRAFDRLNYRKLLHHLSETRPDAIVGTHYLPAEILVPLRKRHPEIPPIHVVLTDHDAHPYWVRSGPRAYFTASEEVRELVVAAGIPAKDVHATGIPISARFSRVPGREEARASLGLPAEGRVALLMSGGFGLREILPFADALLQVPGTRVLAVAGGNDELLAAFREREAEHAQLSSFGFVTDVESSSRSDSSRTWSGTWPPRTSW